MAGKQVIFQDSGERRFPKKNEHYTFTDGPEAGIVFNNEQYSEWDAKESDPKRFVILTIARNDFDPRSQAEKTLARVHEILDAGAERRDRAGKDLDKAAHYQQVVTEIVTELMAAQGMPVKRQEPARFRATSTDCTPLQLRHRVIRGAGGGNVDDATVCYCPVRIDADTIAAALNAMENSK
jgi:hypothetical protein